MANEIAEGTWPCTVLSGEAGEPDDRPGVIRVRINARLDDGPSKGRTTTYEDEVNAKSSIYITRSMKAVGWKGSSVKTFADDVAAWVKATGGKSTAEIRHIEIKKGKRYDKWYDGGQEGPPPIWDKCNSIGRGAKPLSAPKGEALTDADEALRRAMAEDGGGAPADEAPIDPDAIPFCTIANVGLGEIAKVLR